MISSYILGVKEGLVRDKNMYMTSNICMQVCKEVRKGCVELPAVHKCCTNMYVLGGNHVAVKSDDERHTFQSFLCQKL